MGKMTVIFDNGGGTTLQIGPDGHSGNQKWGHYYQGEKQAVEDFCTFLKEGCTCGWDGNEDDAVNFSPSMEEISNGGCVVRSDIWLIDEAKKYDDDKDYWGRNEQCFLKGLSMLLK